MKPPRVKGLPALPRALPGGRLLARLRSVLKDKRVPTATIEHMLKPEGEGGGGHGDS